MSALVLLTGATGFIGSRLLIELLERTDVEIAALVRADNVADAELKARRAWWDHPAISEQIGKRIRVEAGDVSRERLGLSAREHESLARSLTHVIHAAAEVRLDVPAQKLHSTNVRGTANVLELARLAHRHHGLSRFAHLSTAYVAGRRTGDVLETELCDRHGFASEYERSKYEAELLVRAAGRELPVTILRPGMVVGDSVSGYVRSFNTLYVPVRLYLVRRLRVLPLNPSMRVNFVPVDYVARAATALAFDPRSEGGTFHLTAPPEKLPTARELVQAVRMWAREKAGLSLPAPVFLPVRSLARLGGGALDLLGPYFNEDRRFVRQGTDALLGPYVPEWKDFLPRLLDTAVLSGHLHRTGRTVHEQILFRLESRSRPVRLFDLIDGSAVERRPAEIRSEMLEAASALRAMGIRPGDRVAITGCNSTRYLTLDVAIGLAGAVSVPLYYTSPPAEIEAIIRFSGAKLLLVGAGSIIERLGELSSDVAMVSFSREATPAALAGRLTGWQEFLARGKDPRRAFAAPVGPEGLATLRFTSGTTGLPKGAEFTHRGIRWMGETVAALFPFQARSRRIHYLSFLPLSHVVEGILSTYALFYVPAPICVYFLEDFRRLAEALPAVRPTFFFSVPRVYEKLCSSFHESPVGSRYRRRGNLIRGLMRGVIRRGLLRRAGLDRCVQLIVGSAPVADELLLDLRELGIEVYNAYGLTEAPLVALNRAGDNRIGTVGRPLPQTEIRIAPDGEILVRGPQVMRGYFKEREQPFPDGWLSTGDLGRLEDGCLVIEGRKKDLLATSYGKMIQPQKIETLLRSIPGVAEALVVAEGRPFCSALLWLNGGARPEIVEAGVKNVNSRLSHPEQIRRWALLKNDLSIGGGELTANLKLRRRRVEERRSALIAALYGKKEPPADVLRLGGSERKK